jgi:hypothetical protein
LHFFTREIDKGRSREVGKKDFQVFCLFKLGEENMEGNINHNQL